MLSRRIALLPAAVLIVALMAGATIRSVNSDSSPPSDLADAPTIVRDISGSPALSIELQAGRADVGFFDLWLAGRGTYQGTITVYQPVPGTSLLSGSVPVRFTPEDSAPSQDTTLTMAGVIHTPALLASIAITTADRAVHHLYTDQGTVGDAPAVAQAAAAATMTQNWTALYPLMPAEIQSQYTSDQFVQMVNGQPGPAVTAMTINGVGHILNNSGYMYYQQPVNVQATLPDGATKSFGSNLYLVREAGTWHYYSTDSMP